MNLSSRDFVLVFMILSWGSPIGLGIFLAALGYFLKCKNLAENKGK